MTERTDKLVLGGAFAAAVALHAAVLPWVGASVQRAEPKPTVDLVVEAFQSWRQANAGESIDLGGRVAVEVYASTKQPLPDPRMIDRTDVVWLSRDASIDAGDLRLWSNDVPSPDAIEIVDPFWDQATLPAFADGPYFLIFQADVDNRVPDRDRGNNTLARPIYIDGPQTPELSVTSFNAPQRAIPGGSILIDFAVQNIGEGWAANAASFNDDLAIPHWTDRVYLSQNDKLDATDYELLHIDRTSALKPGESYGRSQIELAIPRGAIGPAYLIFASDADQVLDQPSFTAGLAVRQIELVDTQSPDLVVAMLEKPDRLVIHRPRKLAYSVANLGSVSTPGAVWVDGFYLSRSESLDGSAVRLTQAQAKEQIEPRSRSTHEVELTLPESIEPGQWYLIAKADDGQAIDEGGLEDNNTLALPVMVLTEAQADAEIQLGAPDRPERMVVQWIEHERVEEHRAKLSRTVQPALQDRADPVPDAPLVFDPKPPTVAQKDSQLAGDPNNPQRTTDPTQQQDARPKPTAPDATQTDVAPRPQTPGSPTPPRIDGVIGDNGELKPKRPGLDDPNAPKQPTPIDPTPGIDNTPTPKPGERDVKSPADPDAPDTDRTTDSNTPADTESDTDSKNPTVNDSTQPAERTDDTDADEQTKNPDPKKPTKQDGKGDSEQKQEDQSTTAKPAEDQSVKPDGKEADPARPSEQQNPTRAPRDPSEAPPVSTTKVEVTLQEGKVLVGEGIKVTPKMPTPPGTATQIVTLPRNARVRVTFTSDGKVYNAEVIKSTTYKEWDAAIEASLYRWTAEGQAVKDAKPYIQIEWNYLLNDLMEDE